MKHYALCVYYTIAALASCVVIALIGVLLAVNSTSAVLSFAKATA